MQWWCADANDKLQFYAKVLEKVAMEIFETRKLKKRNKRKIKLGKEGC
jgi:hypothetical protein